VRDLRDRPCISSPGCGVDAAHSHRSAPRLWYDVEGGGPHRGTALSLTAL
jgi:hypothetical protein